MAVVTYAALKTQVDGVYTAAEDAIQDVIDHDQISSGVAQKLTAAKAAIVAGAVITDASTES